jgi:hypothetical protein
MSLKASNSEIKEFFHEIKEKMELGEGDTEILTSVIDNDIFGISVILTDEGIVRRLQKEMETIRVSFLKQYANGDYEVFKKYYKAPGEEWTFLNQEQKNVIQKLAKLHKNALQKYFEDRGDLMIYRKAVNGFISSRIKNKESLTDLKEVRNYLLNNYSYHDTLYGLGLNPEIGEDGFVKLNKLKLDENGRLV